MVELVIASVALAAVATGLGVYGTVAQGKAQQEQEEFNAQVASNAAFTANENAQFEADEIRRRGRRVRASQRAAAGKAGIDLSGSFNDVVFDTAVNEEYEVMTAFYKGQLGSNSYLTQAESSRRKASDAKGLGILGAVSTGLSGASNTASLGAQAYTVRKPSSNQPTFN